VAESFTIEAQPRTVVGKKVSQLRAQGLVPAVIYGAHVKPVSLQIPYRALQLTLMKAGGTQLIDIALDGKQHTVLARDVQRDVMRGSILHVDFLAVDLNAKLTTDVPVHFIGESPAVERRTGILAHGINSLTIEALPRDLIATVDVDISGLVNIGDSIHVRDINLGDKLTIIADPDDLIARIAPIPTMPTDEELAAEAGAAEPEVIQKGKIEEEDEE
jgi:large subunit ribosomal protein L25